jgi:hypothetical protein
VQTPARTELIESVGSLARARREKRLAEIDIRMTRIARMRELLATSSHCECLRIDDCARAIS